MDLHEAILNNCTTQLMHNSGGGSIGLNQTMHPVSQPSIVGFKYTKGCTRGLRNVRWQTAPGKATHCTTT